MISDRIATRLLGLPPARTAYTRREERIPMRDGAVLLGEHHIPTTEHPLGTVLIRTPYGRRSPLDALTSRTFAARGYHVLVQSVRGTFGSGGVFDPMVNEQRDGQDTVAWLREQAWFDGRLATHGASYLGWAQWTLMADPPPELRAAVVLVGPHDFAYSVYGAGTFSLHGFLSWSDLILRQEGGPVKTLVGGVTAARRLAPGFAGLPLADSVDKMLSGRAPWFRQWVAHPDLTDPFWDAKRASTALARSTVPTLLMGGWQDLFVEQTLAQYAALHARDVDVALTVGPWTHVGIGIRGAGIVARETLGWLDEHLAGATSRARRTPVRVYLTGLRQWQELPEWPPPTSLQTWWLGPAESLVDDEPPSGGVTADAVTAQFRYDPADPTPSVGGRLLTDAGVRDNRALAARADVLSFTTPPLASALVIAGTPTVVLEHTAEPPHADVFVRLCDVAPDGRAANVADGMLRRAQATGPVEITLDPCYHRVAAGHRLSLLVAGGAYPRFQRNNGTGEPPADATGLVAVTHHVRGGRVALPIALSTTRAERLTPERGNKAPPSRE
ncbi:MAG TPA: CocE/NonD family hydrolase [Pseudonocardia sp.]